MHWIILNIDAGVDETKITVKPYVIINSTASIYKTNVSLIASIKY